MNLSQLIKGSEEWEVCIFDRDTKSIPNHIYQYLDQETYIWYDISFWKLIHGAIFRHRSKYGWYGPGLYKYLDEDEGMLQLILFEESKPGIVSGIEIKNNDVISTAANNVEFIKPFSELDII